VISVIVGESDMCGEARCNVCETNKIKCARKTNQKYEREEIQIGGIEKFDVSGGGQ